MRHRLLRACTSFLAASASIVALGACSSATPPAADPLDVMRGAATTRPSDGEAVARWVLGELLVPGGSPARAIAARKQLDALPPAAQKGLFASLARAVDDESHGRFRGAALAHLDALTAARSSPHPDAQLVGWYSARHLLNMRSSVANLWEQGREAVVRTIDHPGNIGWRARGELVEWWTLDGARDRGNDAQPTPAASNAAAPNDGATAPPAMLDVAAKRYGCIEKARMAGPFGHMSATDHRVHFEAERAGPWPAVFPRDPLRQEPPRLLKVDRTGCALRPVGASGAGIFYVETFLDLPADREVILAVQSSLAVFVDDTEVLTRDTKQWGIWPRFGARLRLEAGRHRIVARVAGAETSVRILSGDGTPLGVAVSDDPAPPYALTRPRVLEDPNVLDAFLVATGVPPQKGTPRPRAPRDTADPVARMLAAYLAHVEGQDDVAAVLIEPLAKEPEKATGLALAMQATYLEKDPIFPQTDARDLTKDVRGRAAAKDPELWWPRFWLALDQAEKAGLPEVAPRLTELADHFREVPDILKALVVVYERAGWKVERAKAVRDSAARFPDDVEALTTLLRLDEEEGHTADADRLAARILALDPDSEIQFQRMLERRDYRAAIKELQRIGSIRKDRRDIALRIADLLTRAGATKESLQKLEAAVQKSPLDATARLDVADARFAAGDRDALNKALVDAIHTGAEPGPLRDAIELVDGTTELTAYRIDGKKVIAEYEASKQIMPGTAARVLDYSTIWIHADGSARMLEHEIIGIQSREAIQEHAEQRVPRGLLLKVRTVKRDGRVMEPEVVQGKPTLTMPHLEVGDYIETESITTLRGDGQGGYRFEGPRWFFREEKIPYWRSEFIAVSPKNRPLDIEMGGSVPDAQVTSNGAFVTRRWRVDKSPALPEEPASAPIQEFLPSVRIGWGINLKDNTARLIDAAADETPRDPRLVRVAESIVSAAPPTKMLAAKKEKGESGSKQPDKAPAANVAHAADAVVKQAELARSIDERARRIYRWVLANVEAGRESDGRRVVIGKSGNRAEAFLHLCRLNGIEAHLGLVRDRLAAPPRGPMSEVETFGSIAVRITTEAAPRWMIVRDKFAPYGYMPSSLRGQAAIILRPGAPTETTPTEGSPDGVTHEGKVDLAADGSATLDLEQRYEGKLAIVLRTALETLPDARLKETIESRLLPQSFPGARLLSVEVKNLADIDQPLVLAMKLEMSTFARVREGELVISPPFPMNLGGIASLPVRETPLYISEQIATRVAMKLTVTLPAGARLVTALAPTSAEDGARIAKVDDRGSGGTVLFDRLVDLPAGRVQPPDYAKFQAFARDADVLLHRDVVVSLGSGTH